MNDELRRATERLQAALKSLDINRSLVLLLDLARLVDKDPMLKQHAQDVATIVPRRTAQGTRFAQLREKAIETWQKQVGRGVLPKAFVDATYDDSTDLMDLPAEVARLLATESTWLPIPRLNEEDRYVQAKDAIRAAISLWQAELADILREAVAAEDVGCRAILCQCEDFSVYEYLAAQSGGEPLARMLLTPAVEAGLLLSELNQKLGTAAPAEPCAATNSQLSRPAKLQPCQEKAYQAWKFALEQMPPSSDGKLPREKEVFLWLREYGPADLKLPANPKTWEKHARAGRKFYDDLKNTPRGGRTGRSIIGSEEAETPKRITDD